MVGTLQKSKSLDASHARANLASKQDSLQGSRLRPVVLILFCTPWHWVDAGWIKWDHPRKALATLPRMGST